jgi:hypothetical protein
MEFANNKRDFFKSLTAYRQTRVKFFRVNRDFSVFVDEFVYIE